MDLLAIPKTEIGVVLIGMFLIVKELLGHFRKTHPPKPTNGQGIATEVKKHLDDQAMHKTLDSICTNSKETNRLLEGLVESLKDMREDFQDHIYSRN